MMNIEQVIALVSVAHHPLSGKEIYSTNDTRALELAMGIKALNHKVVHVGDKGCPALSGYLGMGITKIHCIDNRNKDKKSISTTIDVCNLLAGFLKAEIPDIVVCGSKAQSGESSGLIPYILAKELKIPVISGVLAVKLNEKKVNILQFLPMGKRREITAKPPFILAVHQATPLKIKYAWARAKKGNVSQTNANAVNLASLFDGWKNSPLQKGRKRLTINSDKSGFERMQRSVAISSSGGKIIKSESSLDKAKVVYDLLKEKKLI